MQYQISKAEIKSIQYRIREDSIRLSIVWEGLGGSDLLAQWADGRVASTATRSGMAMERVEAVADDHQLDIETSGEVGIRLLDVVDGLPRVRATVRIDCRYHYCLGLIDSDGLSEEWRTQIEQIASSGIHDLTITVEG